MQQTLLALLALMLAMILAVQQQRRTALQQLGAVRAEVSVMAMAVAVDRLEEISALAFDEHTRADAVVTTAAALTAPSQFGAGSDTPSDDIDDLHDVIVDTFRVASHDTLRFRIHTRVAYASDADPDTETTSATKFKKVSVRVHSMNLKPSVVDTVRLAKTASCGSACAW